MDKKEKKKKKQERNIFLSFEGAWNIYHKNRQFLMSV